MDNITEERACIKRCFKIGKNATDSFESIRLAFGHISLNRCVTFDWFKRFKEGRKMVTIVLDVHQHQKQMTPLPLFGIKLDTTDD